MVKYGWKQGPRVTPETALIGAKIKVIGGAFAGNPGVIVGHAKCHMPLVSIAGGQRPIECSRMLLVEPGDPNAKADGLAAPTWSTPIKKIEDRRNNPLPSRSTYAAPQPATRFVGQPRKPDKEVQRDLEEKPVVNPLGRPGAEWDF